jgi:hypothetical protein
VKKICQTFDGFKKLVNTKFDFGVRLDMPYKLCDLKPAYGYIYEDYINNYYFWGHCDVDTLMGNLSMFLTDDLLAKYDKLFCLGHMTLYKNTRENNRVFMSEYKNKYLYKDVFSESAYMGFDEEWKDDNNVNRIFLDRNRSVYTNDLSLNFCVFYLPFRKITYTGIVKGDNHGYTTEKYKKAIYLWDKGKILRYTIRGNEVCEEEYLYIHLQMRKMSFDSSVLNSDRIQIVPNFFILPDFCEVKKDAIKRTSKYHNTAEMRKLNRSKKWWHFYYYLKRFSSVIKNV